MSEFLDLKATLKKTKLNPVQKMSITSRFKGREFPAESASDDVYQIKFGENIIHIRAVAGGLSPEEMDMVADILQRARKNEQKAMVDMLMIIQLFPLAQETVEVLIEEWKESGVEAQLVSGPSATAPVTP